MKILFDHQIFSSQKFGGISRYHVQLMKYLDVQWQLPLFFSNNFYLRELMSLPGFFPEHHFRGKNRILERLNRFKTVSALKKGDFDIFHPTFYASSSLPFLKKHPMVLTLHDMTHDRFPELPAAKWERKEKYTMAHAAAAVIVPSQFTADELMELYGVPGSKIHVVYHGGPDWKPVTVPAEQDRFLFVGGRTFYKNFTVVLEALKMVPESRLLHEALLILQGVAVPAALVEKKNELPRNDGAAPARKEFRTLNCKKLRGLANDKLATIGSHIVCHHKLSDFADDRQKHETAHGHQIPEEMLAKELSTMSYPFGNYSDISDNCKKICRNARIPRTAANFPGQAHSWSDPMTLPRHVVRNYGSQGLKERMARFL